MAVSTRHNKLDGGIELWVLPRGVIESQLHINKADFGPIGGRSGANEMLGEFASYGFG